VSCALRPLTVETNERAHKESDEDTLKIAGKKLSLRYCGSYRKRTRKRRILQRKTMRRDWASVHETARAVVIAMNVLGT
jgi:hypothetical protein